MKKNWALGGGCSICYILTLFAAAILIIGPSGGGAALQFPSPRKQIRAMAGTKNMRRNAHSEPSEEAPVVQRKTWNPLRLAILRLGLPEPAMTSPLNYGTYNGTFHCAYCDHTLFDADAKYNSGTGWPSFWRSQSAGAVSLKREWDGRMECRCGNCQSHLGHVFMDGPRPAQVDATVLSTVPETDPQPTSYLPRFCINGGALTYQPRSVE